MLRNHWPAEMLCAYTHLRRQRERFIFIFLLLCQANVIYATHKNIAYVLPVLDRGDRSTPAIIDANNGFSHFKIGVSCELAS